MNGKPSDFNCLLSIGFSSCHRQKLKNESFQGKNNFVSVLFCVNKISEFSQLYKAIIEQIYENRKTLNNRVDNHIMKHPIVSHPKL